MYICFVHLYNDIHTERDAIHARVKHPLHLWGTLNCREVHQSFEETQCFYARPRFTFAMSVSLLLSTICRKLSACLFPSHPMANVTNRAEPNPNRYHQYPGGPSRPRLRPPRPTRTLCPPPRTGRSSPMTSRNASATPPWSTWTRSLEVQAPASLPSSRSCEPPSASPSFHPFVFFYSTIPCIHVTCGHP